MSPDLHSCPLTLIRVVYFPGDSGPLVRDREDAIHLQQDGIRGRLPQHSGREDLQLLHRYYGQQQRRDTEVCTSDEHCLINETVVITRNYSCEHLCFK